LRRFFQKISENRNFQRGNITAIPEKNFGARASVAHPPVFDHALFKNDIRFEWFFNFISECYENFTSEKCDFSAFWRILSVF